MLDGAQHRRRHVAGHDLRDMGRKPVTDMATTAAKVQDPAKPAPGGQRLDPIKIGALRMDRARHIVGGAFPILTGHKDGTHIWSPLLMTAQDDRAPSTV
ncbi:hypothetical protein AA103196_3029 [Ameyamaea chiangmaiensis NBRC 103196]|nr:hypothetical protein AA103196_3029 [Ameyamaea chiangmaiensis NBRC 103196]